MTVPPIEVEPTPFIPQYAFNTVSWLKQPDGSPSVSGISLALEVCKEIFTLPRNFLANALAKPHGIPIELALPISPKLRASIEFAKEYAKNIRYSSSVD